MSPSDPLRALGYVGSKLRNKAAAFPELALGLDLHDFDLSDRMGIVRCAQRMLLPALTVSIETIESVFHHSLRPLRKNGPTKGLLLVEPMKPREPALCRAGEGESSSRHTYVKRWKGNAYLPPHCGDNKVCLLSTPF
jgi:hypothetical protein